MNIKAFLRSIIKREEFRNKPLKVIYNVLKWQILSRFRDKVRYDWHSDLIVECEKSDTGFTGNIYYGLMERYETYFFIKVLNKDEFFLDIGANLGSYTLLLNRLCGAKCIAVEPSSKTFKKLSKNVELNNLKNIKLFNFAAGEKNKTVFFTKSLGPENSIVENSIVDHEMVIQKALDDIIDVDISFMKIDTEGNELRVLEGAKNILKSESIMVIMCEINEKSKTFGINEKSLIDYLKVFGLEMCVYKNGTLVPGYNHQPNKFFVKMEKLEIINQRLLDNQYRLKEVEF
jgi:FkbM family methyltransferase